MHKIVLSIIIATFLFLSHTFSSIAKDALDIKGEYYRVAVGDKVKITVYQEGDLSGDFEIKEDGTITYPLLGQVYIENLTKQGIEQKISDLLEEDYLVNPHVRVEIGTYGKSRIMLLGHVQNPGTYPYYSQEGRSLTLLEVITNSGGFTGYAAINGTKIVRTNEDGTKIVINPHMSDIINGRRKDIELKPGDLVIVPERFF